MLKSRYSPMVIGVIEKLGCTVPQKFESPSEIRDAVAAGDAGLCRLVPGEEAVHHLIDPNGSCGIILTSLGRDEHTAMLNVRREGVRKPPYAAKPLAFSRIRLE